MRCIDPDDIFARVFLKGSHNQVLVLTAVLVSLQGIQDSGCTVLYCTVLVPVPAKLLDKDSSTCPSAPAEQKAEVAPVQPHHVVELLHDPLQH